MKISKQFLKDFKQSSAIVIRFDSISTIDLFFSDDRKVITYDYDNPSKLNGVWYCSLYQGLNTQQETIISLLKVGDIIDFNQEDHGHESLALNGFIHDQLMLKVKRYKRKDSSIINKIFNFCFDSQVTSHKANFPNRQYNHLSLVK